MATKKNYLWLGGSERVTPINSNSQFEFDESEIWRTNEAPPSESVTTKRVSRPLKKAVMKKDSHNNFDHRHSRTSLPLNIPDWSKILGNEYEDRRVENNDDSDDDEDDRIPPHEYLARTRVASFSVHEGVGRTLKGRDLSRVRNAIWKQTGFED